MVRVYECKNARMQECKVVLFELRILAHKSQRGKHVRHLCIKPGHLIIFDIYIYIYMCIYIYICMCSR